MLSNEITDILVTEKRIKSLCNFLEITQERLQKKNNDNVVDCRNGKNHKIWAIRNDSTGFPHFLIYDAGAWKWQSAKHFKPMMEA